MSEKRRKFERKGSMRRYKRLFFIVAEGACTEPKYFSVLNRFKSDIHVICTEGRHDSDPKHLLKKMKTALRKQTLKEGDEAWIVADRDEWPENDVEKLYEWSRKSDKFGLVISNPCFELWLLFHFDPGNDAATKNQCIAKLRSCCLNYSKNLERVTITKDMVNTAIERSSQRELSYPEEKWPRSAGYTTMHKLVKKMLVE